MSAGTTCCILWIGGIRVSIFGSSKSGFLALPAANKHLQETALGVMFPLLVPRLDLRQQIRVPLHTRLLVSEIGSYGRQRHVRIGEHGINYRQNGVSLANSGQKFRLALRAIILQGVELLRQTLQLLRQLGGSVLGVLIVLRNAVGDEIGRMHILHGEIQTIGLRAYLILQHPDRIGLSRDLRQ